MARQPEPPLPQKTIKDSLQDFYQIHIYTPISDFFSLHIPSLRRQIIDRENIPKSDKEPADPNTIAIRYQESEPADIPEEEEPDVFDKFILKDDSDSRPVPRRTETAAQPAAKGDKETAEAVPENREKASIKAEEHTVEVLPAIPEQEEEADLPAEKADSELSEIPTEEDTYEEAAPEEPPPLPEPPHKPVKINLNKVNKETTKNFYHLPRQDYSPHRFVSPSGTFRESIFSRIRYGIINFLVGIIHFFQRFT